MDGRGIPSGRVALIAPGRLMKVGALGGGRGEGIETHPDSQAMTALRQAMAAPTVRPWQI